MTRPDRPRPVRVRARLDDETFAIGQEKKVKLQLKNIGATDITVGKWLITGQGNALEVKNPSGQFGPLKAGKTKNVQIEVKCEAAGTVTLRATIQQAANTDGKPVIATPVGARENPSRDGKVTCQ